MSKNDEVCIKNEKLCIKNDEFAGGEGEDCELDTVRGPASDAPQATAEVAERGEQDQNREHVSLSAIVQQVSKDDELFIKKTRGFVFKTMNFAFKLMNFMQWRA